MAVTDPGFNPSGKGVINAIKQNALSMEEYFRENLPDNHVRQMALDHLRLTTMLAVQSIFETGE